MKRLALLGAMKLSSYVRRNFPEEKYILWSDLLGEALPAEDIYDAQYSLIEAIRDEDTEADARLLELLTYCGDYEITHTLLQLAVLRYVNPAYGTLIDMVSSELPEQELGMMEKGRGVSLMAAARITENYVMDGSSEDTAVLEDACERMELILLSRRIGDLLDTTFICDSTLVGYVQGHKKIDRILREDVEIYTPNPEKVVYIYGYEDSADALALKISGFRENLRIHISGEKGSGRLTHAKYIANKLGRAVLIVPYAFITESKGQQDALYIRLRHIFRACQLYKMDLCIRDIVSDENTEVFLHRIQEHVSRYIENQFLYLLADESVKPIPMMQGDFTSHRIARPTGNIALKLWEGMLAQAGLEGYDSAELSAILTLNPGQLSQVVRSMVMAQNTGKQLSVAEIYKLCYEALDDGRYENVHRVEPGYSMADLRLDDKKLEVLKDICNQITHRRKVYEDWGMSKKYAYGRCVSILLAGPPGTGKTMAVHAIAKELGLEMYKVDLSQVVDKYIGETEKRLEEVFRKAEKSNMILFFDEADSIMGKRGDTSDSTGKSYNTQIAFILQRIEEYDGIVVLATNLISNIDNAFMRRIRYVLQFDYPNAGLRLDIWKGAFGENVPLGQDIDFDYLAETFEISGALIKNIVLNATFMAAADNTPVCMEHICKSIQRESSKDRSIISGANLGSYEYLFMG